MRVANFCFRLPLLLALLLVTGCAHTYDVSKTSEYQPWVSKTVSLVAPRGYYHVFSPDFGRDFLSDFDGYDHYPIVAKIPDGHPVVIEAVKRTKGRYLIGNMPYTKDQLLLSMEHPDKHDKRMWVLSELQYVEPFKNRNRLRLKDEIE